MSLRVLGRKYSSWYDGHLPRGENGSFYYAFLRFGGRNLVCMEDYIAFAFGVRCSLPFLGLLL